MITEFGAVAKMPPDGVTRNDAERIKFIESFLAHAKKLDIPCIWWDNNYIASGDEFFGLFDRETLTCHSPEIVKALLDSAR